MARLEIPKNLKDMYRSFHDAVMSAAKGIDKPIEWPLESIAGPGLLETIVNMVVPEDISQAFEGGVVNLTPGYIAANYRTPEMIAALRRAMAAENRARGAVSNRRIVDKIWTGNEISPTPENLKGLYPEHIKGPDIYASESQMTPDPLDQILRGSWFHGMRPEARNVLRDSGQVPYELMQSIPTEEILNRTHPDLSLLGANQYGLPGSTHVTPSYTRFGEPYGVSISASPSIAKNFSADDYIHRVQPLYGGPPTESIIPMWRPEGQAAMNQGYNTAFNEYILSQDIPNQMGGFYPSPVSRMTREVNKGDWLRDMPSGDPMRELNDTMWSSIVGNTKEDAAKFNTLYSKALQAQGKRGILYSPQRYGEYEMLMLDPSFVRPLDYRKVADYNNSIAGDRRFNMLGPPGTPGTARGYAAAQPEFETGATRLSDVFNQVPWVDRISEENKRRIAELVDAKYREQVMNQLFGGR